ncbi:hypothetical protein [Streptomyces sp. NPDC059894]|uniref:hypothetical protein n=1 Tax=unclassified Streptomyces TaxID=2593676 RepID=UPI0036490969
MRIRSALAAAALGVALTAAGATSATAHDGHRNLDKGDHPSCSSYIGGIDTVSSDLFWAGTNCHDGLGFLSGSNRSADHERSSDHEHPADDERLADDKRPSGHESSSDHERPSAHERSSGFDHHRG